MKKTKKRKKCVVRHCGKEVIGKGELCGTCRYFLAQSFYNDSQACRNSLRLVVERVVRDLVPRAVEKMLLEGFKLYAPVGVLDAELVGLGREAP